MQIRPPDYIHLHVNEYRFVFFVEISYTRTLKEKGEIFYESRHIIRKTAQR